MSKEVQKWVIRERVGESIPCRTQSVREGDTVTLAHPAAVFHVLDVPGHTRGHVAYVGRLQGPDAPASLFCGDTLFATGCGRLFEGTPRRCGGRCPSWPRV